MNYYIEIWDRGVALLCLLKIKYELENCHSRPSNTQIESFLEANNNFISHSKFKTYYSGQQFDWERWKGRYFYSALNRM